MSPKYVTIRVSARAYEDVDDCLRACEVDAQRRAGIRAWDLTPRWEDDRTREVILLSVPSFSEACLRHQLGVADRP